jgi:hypothetical protein
MLEISNWWRLTLLVLIGLGSFSEASAKSWSQAILDVEALAQSYRQKYEAMGFDGTVGTAYNEVDVKMHQCAILGRLVGHKNAIVHLEPPQPRPEATARDFAIAATSLENWTIAAKYHRALSSNQKRRMWNLDCVGKYGIASELWVKVSQGFAIEYDQERRSIYIQGDITLGFASTVQRAIDLYPEATTIGIGSGGGAVYEAIVAGRIIRAAGLEVELLNNCYSACPIFALGGTIRLMWWPHSDIGLHQVSVDGKAVSPDHPVYGEIGSYVREMGGNWELVRAMMFRAPPSSMYTATENERCESRIVTNHQRGCLAME